MQMLKIAGFAIAAAMIVLMLRQMRPEFGTAAALASGAVILLMALPFLTQVLDGVGSLADTGGVNQTFLSQLMKVAGVSLLMDFAAQTCRDAGEAGLALKTELAGRIMLLTLALPAMKSLLSQLMSLCS